MDSLESTNFSDTTSPICVDTTSSQSRQKQASISSFLLLNREEQLKLEDGGDRNVDGTVEIDNPSDVTEIVSCHHVVKTFTLSLSLVAMLYTLLLVYTFFVEDDSNATLVDAAAIPLPNFIKIDKSIHDEV